MNIKLRVLVVEDDPQVSIVAVAFLECLNYEPVVVANSHEALSVLENDDNFDIVFTDIIMPGMTGIDLARKLREQIPELPVLLTTGSELDAGVLHGFPLLPKPYNLNALDHMLKVAVKAQA